MGRRGRGSGGAAHWRAWRRMGAPPSPLPHRRCRPPPRRLGGMMGWAYVRAAMPRVTCESGAGPCLACFLRSERGERQPTRHFKKKRSRSLLAFSPRGGPSLSLTPPRHALAWPPDVTPLAAGHVGQVRKGREREREAQPPSRLCVFFLSTLSFSRPLPLPQKQLPLRPPPPQGRMTTPSPGRHLVPPTAAPGGAWWGGSAATAPVGRGPGDAAAAGQRRGPAGRPWSPSPSPLRLPASAVTAGPSSASALALAGGWDAASGGSPLGSTSWTSAGGRAEA